MNNTFYIVKHREDCWNLRIKDIHFTMSAKCSKEEVLDCLYNIILRYRTQKHLLRVVTNLEGYKPLNKEQMQQRSKEEQISLEYMEEVQEVVRKALKEVAMDNDVVRARKRMRITPLAPVIEVEHEVVPEPVEEVLEVVPKKIKRKFIPVKRVQLEDEEIEE